MNSLSVLPAPKIEGHASSESPWRREQRAFLTLKPSLLGTHRGQYVAVLDGQVAASGGEKVSVALEAYARHGYRPIFVGLVSEAPRRAVRMPSPRLVRDGAGE